MQNKYKLPDYVRSSALSVVKSYEAYKKDIKDEENRILSFGSGHYETIGQERVYLPSGKGGKSSPTEDQAMQLERLHNSYKYRCVQVVENSMSEVFKYDDFKYSLKIRQALLQSCVDGRNFTFTYSGIDGMSCSTFYRLKNQFLYIISVKMNFI